MLRQSGAYRRSAEFRDQKRLHGRRFPGSVLLPDFPFPLRRASHGKQLLQQDVAACLVISCNQRVFLSVNDLSHIGQFFVQHAAERLIKETFVSVNIKDGTRVALPDPPDTVLGLAHVCGGIVEIIEDDSIGTRKGQSDAAR